MPPRLDHVGIYVEDLEEALAFYCGVLRAGAARGRGEAGAADAARAQFVSATSTSS